MKKKFKINPVIVLTTILSVTILTNCDKKEKDNSDKEPAAPTASTDTASFVSQTWATFNGLIKGGNLPTTISFEYDNDSAQEAFRYTIAAEPDTLSGNIITRRTSNLTGLMPNTTYYYRVKAENSLGKSYSEKTSFTTLSVEPSDIVFNPSLTYDEISDIEGNTYKTIKIGDQIWMAENLAVTKYNDGTPIPLVVSETTWSGLSTDAYCWYNNIEVKYGALYNWYAVNTGKLCPTGWHVATDEEWTALTDFLGGPVLSGGKLKETGDLHWANYNTESINSSGFTALPGGYRHYQANDYINTNSYYGNATRYGYWWTSSSNSDKSSFGRNLNYGYSDINKISIDNRIGASVRCVKD